MEYFVSPSGNDDDSGEEHCPFRTIWRGLQGTALGETLQPGDILTLRGGTYTESVWITHLVGEDNNKITIRSYSGERAVIETHITGPGNWVKATTLDPEARKDEWAWSETFPENIKPNRGAFLHPPYRRLVTYSTTQDFRSKRQRFRKLFNVEKFDPKRGPYKVTDESSVPLVDPETNREFTYPWVYMGPGLRVFHDAQARTNRVHVRLSHTKLNIPGLEDYLGPTNPNEAGLAICDLNVVTLLIEDSHHLNFSNLTVRFGGRNTIEINNSSFLNFDEVDVDASSRGIRFGPMTDITFQNCKFDGGLPPWFFRTDKKAEYDGLLTKQGKEPFHNSLGKPTVDVLMYGEGNNKQNLEIHHCEFVNGHDLYLVASNTQFHHNWINNLNDEGLVIDSLSSASGKIHSNVIARCLSAISMAGGLTAGRWDIYRNLVDLRQPTAGKRPRKKGDTDVFRFGSVFKSNENPNPDGPFYVFQNTFLVADQREQASYMHYRSAKSPHFHLSFNNIFVAVNPTPESDVAISFVPSPCVPCPTDGNLYHRYGAATNPAFRSLLYKCKPKPVEGTNYVDLDELRCSQIFEDSKDQYPPGYEANSLFTNPEFLSIASDGAFDPLDDLRLGQMSPAKDSAIPLPPDLEALDDVAGPPGPPWPFPETHAIGCYRYGGGPLRVGVHGDRHFPA